jgi:diaminopimelate decarboxylase
MAEGILVAANLAEEINSTLGKRQITHLDIGGGLPVDFTQDTDNPSFKEYADFLQKQVPVLFDGSYQVTTEFGRAISAKNAITIGRVEYTKNTGARPIALTHIGVQTLVRTVYEPEYWKRRISAYSSQGLLKTDDEVVQDIAGPACFSGDLIAKERLMPRLQPDDYIMVHDTGAYHFSNHYQYNALPRLPVYGYTIDKHKNITFEVISLGQSTQDVINDYS